MQNYIGIRKKKHVMNAYQFLFSFALDKYPKQTKTKIDMPNFLNNFVS